MNSTPTSYLGRCGEGTMAPGHPPSEPVGEILCGIERFAEDLVNAVAGGILKGVRKHARRGADNRAESVDAIENLRRSLARTLLAGNGRLQAAVELACEQFIAARRHVEYCREVGPELGTERSHELKLQARMMQRCFKDRLNELDVKIRDVSVGDHFDEVHHRVTAIRETFSADEIDKVLEVHSPAFCWTDHLGQPQVIGAEVVIGRPARPDDDFEQPSPSSKPDSGDDGDAIASGISVAAPSAPSGAGGAGCCEEDTHRQGARS